MKWVKSEQEAGSGSGRDVRKISLQHIISSVGKINSRANFEPIITVVKEI